MSTCGSRLFRAIDYRSRLRGMAVSGPLHAAYMSEHPDDTAARAGGLDSLEKEIASADLEDYDRETLLAEIESYRKVLGEGANDEQDFFDALKPTWRDMIVAALAAYATWKGRDWLEVKIEEFARKQAAYVAEEMRRLNP